MGKPLPLSGSFLKALTTAQELKPVFDGTATHPVTVRATGPALIEGRSFRGVRTMFSIRCGDRQLTAKLPRRRAEHADPMVSQDVQGHDDNVTFYTGVLSDAPGARVRARKLSLVKTYEGSAGFLRFLDDFRTGSHRFDIDELRVNPSPIRKPYAPCAPSPPTSLSTSRPTCRKRSTASREASRRTRYRGKLTCNVAEPGGSPGQTDERHVQIGSSARHPDAGARLVGIEHADGRVPRADAPKQRTPPCRDTAGSAPRAPAPGPQGAFPRETVLIWPALTSTAGTSGAAVPSTSTAPANPTTSVR